MFADGTAIYGTHPRRSEADFLRDQTWAADKAALQRTLSDEMRQREGKFLEEFLRPPDEGAANSEKGRWLVGWDNRLSPIKMREVLAEMMSPPPLLPCVRRAQFQQARDASIRRARLLMQAARQREAIQFLLREAGRDIASKEPQIIYDGLSQYAAVIEPLEGELASKLRNEAATLAAAHGLQPLAS